MAKHEQPDKGWREWVLKTLPIQMGASMAEPAPAGFEPGPANPQPFSVPMSLAPSFDVVELLPPGGADRLRALRQNFLDTNKLIPKFDAIKEVTDERLQAEARLRRLTDHQSVGGFHLDPTDPRVLEAQKHLDKATDDARRLKELEAVRSATWHGASHVLSAVESWLKNGKPPGVMLEDHEVDVPKLAKGENGLPDAIENRRRRVRELRADLHRIRSAPYPSSYAKQQMRAQIEALAMSGAPNVSNLIEHDRPITWLTQMLRSEVHNTPVPSVAFAETHDLLPLIAWLHKSALVAALDREIDAEADDKAAMTHEVRQKVEAEVQADLLAVEYGEARLVEQAQADKLPVEHRNDCAPQAILQVRLVTAPHTNGRGTSPQHVITFAGGRR